MAVRGFTLIEMLIVLVILGLTMAVVGLAVPEWRTRSALRETAAGLERLLTQAHDAALRQQAPLLVHFDPEARRIGIPALGRWQAVPDGFDLTLTGAAIGRDGDVPALLFLGDGSSSGGILTLGRGDRRLSLRIAWLTGTISQESPP
ncbi:general secretion pathway protein H [Inquilinus ginsengisoli]|uniref:General secretion pathway protein H n=1 Tax=Inquilinus ginsengisoli TaxID=363840 RepID=A0ABU1JQH5_9PROT|nr:prepilin-type N-terminal cleavage/methylation domain-containing protein [Inquilinus ginsengisoli]MDR6290870.1 general secretion pathway protein H [Inquilinus ginsengisoli]